MTIAYQKLEIVDERIALAVDVDVVPDDAMASLTPFRIVQTVKYLSTVKLFTTCDG